MLAACFGEPQYGSAGLAFAVDVGLSVAKLVSSQLEEAAEALVLTPSCGDVLREHTEEYPHGK